MKFIDVHAHLNFPDYQNDADEVVRRAFDSGVWIINVGTDRKSSRKAVEMARFYPSGMWAAVGQHPTEKEIFDYGFYEKLAADSKVVAIGECGLDYAVFVRERSKRLQKRASAEAESEGGLQQKIKKQKEIFIKHIELANELKKPLMIHCRDAFGDLIEILTANRRLLIPDRPGIIHFFTGSKENAEILLEMGFYFSFGGLITFNRSLDEIIDFLPIERILLETDSPFVAPEPYRGKRNEPAYVVETAKKLAILKNVSLEKISDETFSNAQKLFAL
ncbi:TatD family hydrolase [Candidatus Wolfebacteria bacterium]|nr:TatD family hydrolase [Candidatus Wolfebacteria bacterium]